MATETTGRATVRYRVTGMDCTGCVAKIEKAVQKVPGVNDVRVSLTSRVMTLSVSDETADPPPVELVVTALGYQLDRLGVTSGAGDAFCGAVMGGKSAGGGNFPHTLPERCQ